VTFLKPGVKENSMHILQVASEIAPIAKVGGLGDVCMGLSRELTWKGHQVEICIPKYDCLETSQLAMASSCTPFRSYFQSGWCDGTMKQADINGDLHLCLFESHHQKRFFDRGCIYGCLMI
jgi:starch synthase